ncbi:MAG: hypothetical protein ABMB14_30635 [Myxococcota bacterium]
MADPDDDDDETSRIAAAEWLPPVASPDELPRRGVRDGVFCWVEAGSDVAIWQFTDGAWIRIGRPGR